MPVEKLRSDYKKPDFLISHTDLTFDLKPTATLVTSKLKVERNGTQAKSIKLDGVDLTLISVKLNGLDTDQYHCQGTILSIDIELLVTEFNLEIITKIDPENNHSLEGLYLSDGAFCTQCEAEGFRKVTYYLDRPDVLSEYEVTIQADKKQYPYLLSNGNKVAEGELPDGRHWVKWHDPYRKPSYLFALVAGNFDLLIDTFETMSGRQVALELYVDKGNLSRGKHAIQSMQKAMKWDEETFNLEYDLDVYMIVAVDFFNMGAMENKGLNVFNSKFVLADSESATDEDYFNIESVIAHEYFHNWTGNRVTCRDWFQLSLKEGLTVFRDQEFSADMASPVINRIKNVNVMRQHQFAEDSGPMSHPIRPDKVIEMNNFYTVTVYDKGAEVIRMIQTIIGKELFKTGLALYLNRHDGQAATCDDFVAAMQDASGIDLALFKRWYSQSGTPILSIQSEYDDRRSQLCLSVSQETLPTAEQSEKKALHIPLDLELVGITEADNQSSLISVTKEREEFIFSDVPNKPTLSLLRNFSAPVKLIYDYTDDELITLMGKATDEFARWDASQILYSRLIHEDAVANEMIDSSIIATIKSLITNASSSADVVSEMMTLPNFETLCQQIESVDIDQLYQARESLFELLSTSFESEWLSLYNSKPFEPYAYEQQSVRARRLRNLSLAYLAKTGNQDSLIKRQFHESDNMTDALGALKAAQQSNIETFDELMTEFETKWRQDPLVMDKWFSLNATCQRDDIICHIEKVSSHNQFSMKNPNRVRALIGSFAFYNTLGFHNGNGEGYEFLTDYLIKLDDINPQATARIVTPLTQWQKLDDRRQKLVKIQLERLLGKTKLSPDLFEKVTKSLS